LNRFEFLGWIEPRWEFLFKQLPDSFDGKTILDVGFGQGFLGWLLKHHYPDDYYNLIGIDAHLPFITVQNKMNIYNRVYHGGIDTVKAIARIRELDFFDYIFCLEVLEHNDKNYAMEIIESLKDHTENTLFITVPYQEPVKEIKRQWVSFRLKMESDYMYAPHISSWSKEDFKDPRFEYFIMDNRKQMSKSVRLFDSIRRKVLGNIWYEKLLMCVWS
jgi:hypothetical protein